jgi:hypothetical protein
MVKYSRIEVAYGPIREEIKSQAARRHRARKAA